MWNACKLTYLNSSLAGVGSNADKMVLLFAVCISSD